MNPGLADIEQEARASAPLPDQESADTEDERLLSAKATLAPR